MTDAPLLVERHERVLLLTLNRPARRNAFNDLLYDAVRTALLQAQDDDAISVVVITGAPGAFSAGQDMKEMGRSAAFGPFADGLAAFDKPLLAAVNGVTVGVGLTMLLHCDVVYVAAGARLRAPFTSLGLVPEAGSSFLLSSLIGSQKAAELFFTSRWISAAEAVSLGLAARLVGDDELLPTTLEKAREIAAQPLAALRDTKRVLQATRREALRAARVNEDTIQIGRLRSPEHRAAVERFLKRKRRPS